MVIAQKRLQIYFSYSIDVDYAIAVLRYLVKMYYTEVFHERSSYVLTVLRTNQIPHEDTVS